MSPAALLLTWLFVSFVLALASAVWDGWRYNSDPAGGILLAIMWPVCALAAVVIGPFWLAYKLGEAARDWCSSPTKGTPDAG